MLSIWYTLVDAVMDIYYTILRIRRNHDLNRSTRLLRRKAGLLMYDIVRLRPDLEFHHCHRNASSFRKNWRILFLKWNYEWLNRKLSVIHPCFKLIFQFENWSNKVSYQILPLNYTRNTKKKKKTNDNLKIK